jgi:hypothetical protein
MLEEMLIKRLDARISADLNPVASDLDQGKSTRATFPVSVGISPLFEKNVIQSF